MTFFMKHAARFLTLWFIYFTITLRASYAVSEPPSNQAPFLGHNLTSSSLLIPHRKLTVGPYALGWGVTPFQHIATSPWLYFDYNMYNIHYRWARQRTPHSRSAINAQLFHTYPLNMLWNYPNFATEPGAKPKAPLSGYQQTSLNLQYILGLFFSQKSFLHIMFAAHYFWDDERAFSLRPPSAYENPLQITVSTLWSYPLSETWLLNFELGGLGSHPKRPFAHGGLSMAFKNHNWLLQFGGSVTAGYGYQLWYLSAQTAEAFRLIPHPEIQIQYFH